MKGLGTDDEKLIEIYGNKSREEINAIAYQFALEHGDLIEWIKGDTSGWYETSLISLATPYSIYMARLFRKALEGLGTKEKLLVDLLTTQSKWDILEATRLNGILYGEKEKPKKNET